MKALNGQRLLLVVLLWIWFPDVGASLLIQPAKAAQDIDVAQNIYADELAPGWSNWSWATVDLKSTVPVHSGSYSIAVTYGAWQGLYLHYPELSTAGFTQLRFYIHGGLSGGQRLNVYATYSVNGSNQNGPEVAVPPPTANTWTEVRLPLAELGVANASLTGLVWQDVTGNTQPTLYVDDIALVAEESPDGPTLSAGYVLPSAAPADGATDVVVRVQVGDPQGLSDVASVMLDGSALGWAEIAGEIALRDDGWSNDGAASDGLYGAVFTVPRGTPSGEQMLLVTAQDQAGHRASLQLGAFVILAPAGGQIPSRLPEHIGWGSNAWSEMPGQDWQVNSGVPWDYVYQYITYDWYVDGWGGNFIGRFVNQAWGNGYVPLISVYMMLDLPPTCGESATCYASKLQNPAAVSTYLAALQEAARQAAGTQPVIFQLEPDFYGFMQQLSNSGDRPPGIQPDDPNSYPVALNVAGYPNTLSGFGQRMVDVVHTTASNALVAPMASMWATNGDPNSVTVSQVIGMGQRTAAFIDAMGGAQSDLLTVEWSDRDAGSGLSPWWDDTNLTLPRPTRAILWGNALSAAAHKRLILWQMPVGNMSLDNTCDHYRDNRAAYAFQHPRDLFDAGVFAVLFGGGAACQTQVTTDGGFVAAQGAIAYAPPSTPTRFAAGTVTGALVSVHWDENTEPDVWGYRVTYQSAEGGPAMALDAGRKNARLVLLPRAGDWHISTAAYDAMGHLGPASAVLTVTTTVDAKQVFLPLIGR